MIHCREFSVDDLYMFFRTVKGSNGMYLYLVEGYRDGGKVKQRTIASFGKVSDLCPDQLKEMGLKLLGLCPNNTLIDLDHTEELCRKNWGIPQIVDNLWNKFKLSNFFTAVFYKRDIKYDIESVIKLLLADRLGAPCSKLKTYENQNYYDNHYDVELHNIYKTLNELCSLKSQIEKHLFEQSKLQSYVNLSAVFFDVTTFHFESVNQDELRNFGYSKNAKFNEVQVVLSLLITEDGIPLGYDLFSGNTYEGHTLSAGIKKLKEQYDIKKVIVVADRGINSGANLHALIADGFEYIVGNRFKNLPKKVQNVVLGTEDYVIMNTDSRHDVFKYKIIDHEKEIRIDNKIEVIASKLICTWSSKRAAKDRRDRERLVNKAEYIIKNGDSSKMRGAKKYLLEDNKSNFSLNVKKVEADAKWDGFYVIETSDEQLSAEKVLSAYHQLWKIEESFKLYKSHLETRPLYHWTPDRIAGHFVLSYIAFLFERVLEIELRKTNSEDPISPSNIRKALNSMEYSELNCGSKIYKLFGNIEPLGLKILESLKITPPRKAISV